MSIDIRPNDCGQTPYPQWGETCGVDTDDVDWAGTGQHSEADTDADTAEETGDRVELRRGDGTPESWGPDAGATTAEYAITTLAACGFAALLVVILKSEPIKELVTGVIQTALGLGA